MHLQNAEHQKHAVYRGKTVRTEVSAVWRSRNGRQGI